MIRLGFAIFLVLVPLNLSGCVVGYNSTLFYTQSNIGLDAETKPPTAEISISRREGVIEPGFEGGQTSPVLAGFRSHNNPFSRFFFGVQSTFAGGDAAQALVQGPGGLTVSEVSGLCLSKKPDTPLLSFASILEKGEVMPFAFGTDSVFGLKVAWSGTAGPFPDSLRLGFNRKEAAWAPLFGTDVANCSIPGTKIPGSYIVWMPSFLAALDAGGQAGQSPLAASSANGQAGQPSNTGVGVDWLQYFATGISATTLANRDDVRSILLKQAFPSAIVGEIESNPNVACLQNWVAKNPDNGKTLAAWWAQHGLPPAANAFAAMTHAEYSSQRAQFLKEEAISCP